MLNVTEYIKQKPPTQLQHLLATRLAQDIELIPRYDIRVSSAWNKA
jgi:hypothetical protein